MSSRIAITWTTPDGVLRAYQPDPAEIVALAPGLAAAYNDRHNASMMGHGDPMSVDDVITSYTRMIADGDALFVFEVDGAFVGDGDLRGRDGGHAELAIMLAARSTHGRGLGTRFALVLHAYGFRQLGLERIYVGIVPVNSPSQRMFTRLGHRVDDSPVARAYADAADEVTMSIGRAEFEARHGAAADELRVQSAS